MEHSIFLLAKDPENDCHDLIFHRDGDLRVRVICVGDVEYKINPDELQFFAKNDGTELMFETIKYDFDDPGLIIEAIRWYANYIGNPNLEIEAEFENHQLHKGNVKSPPKRKHRK
ncbi:MAG: hypothetical protein ABI390_07965 [Daejeonella sp.]